MSKAIRELYRKKGVADRTPNGKSVHSKKFHDIVSSILSEHKDYSYSRAASIAMSQLGRNKAVKKGHWQTGLKSARR